MVAFISGIGMCEAKTVEGAASASMVFYISTAAFVVLAISYVLCPVPNPYGTALIATANQLPDNTLVMKQLKEELVDVGRKAIRV